MKKFLILPILLLMACTDSPAVPNTPAQIVFQLQSDYNAAVAVETAYDKLPDCAKTAIVLCADSSVKKSVRKYDDKAWAAIQNAQIAVRLGGAIGSSIDDAIANAKLVVSSFIGVTQTLKVE